jgi:hypothetical protein
VVTHADEPRVKVLSIVGSGRSGTTVLAAILGEVAGFFDAGELHWVWGRSLVEQRPCGCGRPPAKCPIWSRVVEGVFGVPPRTRPPAEGAASPMRSSRTSGSWWPVATGSGSCEELTDRSRGGRPWTG